ncbi:MAG: hypothetical protein M1820_010615 [Bogoriella megaspora]|nr:MAG: hypothetical protein M1820_010615 [Bogoriella megaspora]
MADQQDFALQEQQADEDIARLRSQINLLHHRRSLLSTTLLSHPQTLTHLSNSKSHRPSTKRSLSRLTSQHHLNTTNTHRLLTTSTLVTVTDPSPTAVDSGRILGIRIDVLIAGRTAIPYTLLLHRPYPELTNAWRVHKHTIPAAVPLQQMLERWLPFPEVDATNGVVKDRGEGGQDLVGLVRELRREVVRWGRRKWGVEELRGWFGVTRRSGGIGAEDEEDGQDGVRSVDAVGGEGREVRIEWGEGVVGMVRLGEDGRVEGCVVQDGEGVRRRDEERLLMEREDCGLDDVGEWMREVYRRRMRE